MMKKLIAASVFNFITKVFAALVVLAAQVYISRYYAVNELADYSRLINYINIATVITGLGLNISAVYHLRKQSLSSRIVFTTGSRTFLTTSVVAFVLLAAAGLPMYDALLIAAFSFLNNLFFLHNSKAIADGKFSRYNVQMLAYAFLHLLAIGIMVVFRNEIAVRNVIALQCCYLLLLNMYYFGKNRVRLFSHDAANYQRRRFFSYGARIFITNSMGILLYSGDIILLDILLPDSQLAEYLLAATAIKFLWLGIDSVGLVLFPEFVKPSGEAAPSRALNRVFAFGAIAISSAIIVFYFIGNYLVHFVYGQTFTQLHRLLLLLMVASIGVMLYKFLSRFFAANDNWLPIYISLVAGIATEAALIFVWVPQYGTVGAAYASIAAYSLTGLIIAVWYYLVSGKYKLMVS